MRGRQAQGAQCAGTGQCGGLAQQRAAMYAKSLGMQVRRIVSISEGGGFAPPQPMAVMSMARAEKMADTSISPGENTLSVNLDVVFELGR